jgi:hypothetical protein
MNQPSLQMASIQTPMRKKNLATSKSKKKIVGETNEERELRRRAQLELEMKKIQVSKSNHKQQ